MRKFIVVTSKPSGNTSTTHEGHECIRKTVSDSFEDVTQSDVILLDIANVEVFEALHLLRKIHKLSNHILIYHFSDIYELGARTWRCWHGYGKFFVTTSEHVSYGELRQQGVIFSDFVERLDFYPDNSLIEKTLKIDYRSMLFTDIPIIKGWIKEVDKYKNQIVNRLKLYQFAEFKPGEETIPILVSTLLNAVENEIFSLIDITYKEIKKRLPDQY